MQVSFYIFKLHSIYSSVLLWVLHCSLALFTSVDAFIWMRGCYGRLTTDGNSGTAKSWSWHYLSGNKYYFNPLRKAVLIRIRCLALTQLCLTQAGMSTLLSPSPTLKTRHCLRRWVWERSNCLSHRQTNSFSKWSNLKCLLGVSCFVVRSVCVLSDFTTKTPEYIYRIYGAQCNREYACFGATLTL